MDLGNLLGDVSRIVVEACSLAMNAPVEVEQGANPVTDIDKKVHDFLSKELTGAFSAPVLSEEGPEVALAGEFTWVIDPLDGTLNAIAGSPDYAISVALTEGHTRRALLGVVASPKTDIRYEALQGHGVTLNNRKLSPSPPKAPILAIGLPGLAPKAGAQLGAIIGDAISHGWILRQTGSAALDLCRAAQGTWAAFYEPSVQIWDVSAGLLVARELGLSVLISEASVPTEAPLFAFDILAYHDNTEFDSPSSRRLPSILGLK